MARKRRKTTKRRRGSFQKCVGAKLRGKRFRTRASARAAFKKAVRACKR